MLWIVRNSLPMTVCFMALFACVLGERLGHTLSLLVILLAVGAWSVWYWQQHDDLRAYIVVQFYPILMLPFVMTVWSSPYSHQHHLLMGAVWYGIAKWVEVKDRDIFVLTNGLVSGHTLKHIIACGAVVECYRMLWHRAHSKE